jgi:peptidyl-prolyl cis-trans isomerase C
VFRNTLISSIAAVLLLTVVASGSAGAAADTVLARVNGAAITELDIQLAAAEIGSDLGSLPEPTKRRVLVEYLIENELMAAAATKAGLGSLAKADPRGRYWSRRGLRESYFYNHITGTVTADDARKFYGQHIAARAPEKEVKARHILLKSKEQAVEIFEKIAHGADFSKMASEHSADPGTKLQGGLLGFFGAGRMVPQFEAAAFKLAVGEVSDPVQTQFGWHLIKVEEVRTRDVPKFADIQEQILLSLIHSKAKQIAGELRGSAKVEYVDPVLKQELDGQNAGAGSSQPR